MKKPENRKAHILAVAVVILLLCFLLIRSEKVPAAEEAESLIQASEVLSVCKIQATRHSNQEIEISWTDDLDRETACYLVKRRVLMETGAWGEWSVVAEVLSDGMPNGEMIQIIDVLPDSSIRQYAYSVGVQVENPAAYVGEDSPLVLASNLLVCIDPGHYAGVNQIHEEETYGYAEGDVTLSLGLFLQQYLKELYGIDSCMTRTDGTISLGGYSNGDLDSGHLTLRGLYAGETGSDLFVSLHTNANEDNANGYPTCSQPVSINKPILILNTTACASREAVETANRIGSNLAQASFAQGIASTDCFQKAAPGKIAQWTDEYNDSTELPGTVFCRLNEDGSDFYGILRGADNVCVPGIIIEHGMHTVPEVRRAAMEGDLLIHWARADACGIAQGFGFAAYGEETAHTDR